MDDDCCPIDRRSRIAIVVKTVSRSDVRTPLFCDSGSDTQWWQQHQGVVTGRGGSYANHFRRHLVGGITGGTRTSSQTTQVSFHLPPFFSGPCTSRASYGRVSSTWRHCPRGAIFGFNFLPPGSFRVLFVQETHRPPDKTGPCSSHISFIVIRLLSRHTCGVMRNPIATSFSLSFVSLSILFYE